MVGPSGLYTRVFFRLILCSCGESFSATRKLVELLFSAKALSTKKDVFFDDCAALAGRFVNDSDSTHHRPRGR